MGQHPSILKDINDPQSKLHIGGLLSIGEPLCEKFSGRDADLIGWVSSRGWKPGEKYCRECAALYEKGLAWKFPSARG